MARIIYKEGYEGQNTLESIEGIEIDLLNGKKALIYPKYSEEVMLPVNKIESWNANQISEIEALKKDENLWATVALLKCGSPAAEFVSNFYSGKHGLFGLPTLLAAIEIKDQKFDIDALAITVKGTDLLCNFTGNIWSCSRSVDANNWVASDHYYFASDYSYLGNSNLAVPVILYSQRRGACPA